MSLLKSFQNNKTLLYFWIIGILSFVIRAFISFSQELLIGNGGYYPLQVRTVLERGELAFSDMPFLFYFEAGIVKLLTLLGYSMSDQLIITVVQLVDSISIPLLLIPLYQILKLTNNKQFSYLNVTTALFAVLSFFTLHLTTTSQKNALAITFLMCSIYWLMKYVLKDGKLKHIVASILFLLLTGLTHFGTFTFAILIGVVFIIIRFKKKALVPLSLLVVVGSAVIYFFDPVRFERLASVWKDLLSTTPRPPQIVLLLIFGGIAYLIYRFYSQLKSQFSDSEKTIIITLTSLLIIIPFPIIDPQFSDRLTTFLFIPMVILTLIFSPYLTNKRKKIISICFALVSLVSITISIVFTPPLSLSKEAFKDLKQLESSIPDAKNTVIISRHNLEFWIAWTLRVSVSQETKFDSTLIRNYEHVYIINQTQGLDQRQGPPQQGNIRNHFQEPIVPEGSTLLDSTEYFKLYSFQNGPK